MKRGDLSGWQLKNRNMQQVKLPPPMPTRWERACYRHSVTEREAIDLLSGGMAPELARWVRANAQSAFIPEGVLMALGIDSRWLI